MSVYNNDNNAGFADNEPPLVDQDTYNRSLTLHEWEKIHKSKDQAEFGVKWSEADSTLKQRYIECLSENLVNYHSAINNGHKIRKVFGIANIIDDVEKTLKSKYPTSYIINDFSEAPDHLKKVYDFIISNKSDAGDQARVSDLYRELSEIIKDLPLDNTPPTTPEQIKAIVFAMQLPVTGKECNQYFDKQDIEEIEFKKIMKNRHNLEYQNIDLTEENEKDKLRRKTAERFGVDEKDVNIQQKITTSPIVKREESSGLLNDFLRPNFKFRTPTMLGTKYAMSVATDSISNMFTEASSSRKRFLENNHQENMRILENFQKSTLSAKEAVDQNDDKAFEKHHQNMLHFGASYLEKASPDFDQNDAEYSKFLEHNANEIEATVSGLREHAKGAKNEDIQKYINSDAVKAQESAIQNLVENIKEIVAKILNKIMGKDFSQETPKVSAPAPTS